MPKSLFLPITKDHSCKLYLTQLDLGTPFTPKNVVFNLDNRFLWMDCIHEYHSSTRKNITCGSAACSRGQSPGCGICDSATTQQLGCNSKTCNLVAENKVRGGGQWGSLTVDSISLRSTVDRNPVAVPGFIFSCTSRHSLFNGLPKRSEGMLGLGRHPASLLSQLSSASGGIFRRRFAICLPSGSKSSGVALFGDSPYVFYPGYNKSKGIDVSSRLNFTKLSINPVSSALVYRDGEKSAEYFLGVNDKPIELNSTFLKFEKRGYGGTKISTTHPYTLLYSSIYRSLVMEFDREMISGWNASKVPAVSPFNDCYTIGNLGMTGLGLGVPDIAFVFQNKNVKCIMYGANSMVEINRDVFCLGFLDGGVEATASITIGAHQLQDNLLVFDLAASKLGFSSTLLWEEIECTNYGFS